MEEQEIMWPQRQTLEGYGHKPRDAGRQQQLEEAKEGFSPRASKGKQGPADI